MEVKGGHERKCIVMVCEMIGTALLTYGVIMTDKVASIPFSLFASILIFGAISGGHFNPAFTLAVFITEDDKSQCWPFMLLIWLGQFLGAMLAIGIAFVSLFDSSTVNGSVPDELIPRLCPIEYPKIDSQSEDCDNWDGSSVFSYDYQVLVNELIGTFVFVTLRLILKVKEERIRVTSNSVSEALGTSLGLLAMLRTGTKLGVCFNPAIVLALTFNSQIFLGEGTSYLLHYMPFYLIGPVLGACLAALFHVCHKNVMLEGESK